MIILVLVAIDASNQVSFDGSNRNRQYALKLESTRYKSSIEFSKSLHSPELHIT